MKKKPSRFDWAYLAGFYDGEGAISTTAQHRKGNDYFQVKFVVSNTCRSLLESLVSNFGGSLYVSAPSKNKNHRQVYQWHMSAKDEVLPVLRGMFPYLRYKKKEVLLAISFFSDMPTSSIMTNEERSRRFNIVKLIRGIPGRRVGVGRKKMSLPVFAFRPKCRLCRSFFYKQSGAEIYCSGTCRASARQRQLEAHNERRKAAGGMR